MTARVVSPTGNDTTGNGSEGAPYATVNKAASLSTSGDEIVVRGVLANQVATISGTYSTSNPLIIRPHDTDGGQLDGTWTYPTGAAVGSGPNGDFVYGGLASLTGTGIKWQVPITRSRGRGISIAGSYITIQNYFSGQYLTLGWSRNAGLNANDASNITCIGVNVEYSGSFYQSIRDPSVTNWPVAFNFVKTPNVLVDLCRSYHNWGEGGSAGRGSNNVIFRRSIWLNNMSVVLYVNRCDTVWFDRNIIGHDGNATGFNQSSGLALRNEKNPGSTPPLTNITVTNNLLLGAKNNLLIANNQEDGDTIEDVFVYHNTFINATSVDNSHYNMRLVTGDRNNINIKRNLIWQADGRYISLGNYASGEYHLDQNCWTGNAAQVQTNARGSNDLSGVQMEAPNTAWTAAGVGYTDAFLDKYRLLSSYGLGTIAAVGGIDLEDTARTYYSIGAIEHNDAGEEPPNPTGDITIAGDIGYYAFSGSATGFSFDYDVPACDCLVIVAEVWKTSEVAFVLTPTVGGNSITEVATDNTTTTSRYYLVGIWRKLNPTPGVTAIAGSYTTAGVSDQVIHVIPLNGVYADTPTGVYDSDNSGNWDVPLTTSGDNSMLLGGLIVYGGDNIITAGTGAVVLDQRQTGGSNSADITGAALYRTCGDAGDYTLSALADNDTKGLMLAVEFIAAPFAGDELAADGLTMGAPDLGTPALSQIVDLTPDALTTVAPTLDTPVIGQVHILTAQDATAGAVALQTPALAQNHSLTANGLTTGAVALGAPLLSSSATVNELAATDLVTGAPALDAGALGQTHALVVVAITTDAPTLGLPAIGQAHTLTADDLTTGAPIPDTTTLLLVFILAAVELEIDFPVLGMPQLAQTHALAAVDLTMQAPTLGNPALGHIYQLSATGITTGAPVLDSPSKITYEFVSIAWTVAQPSTTFSTIVGG